MIRALAAALATVPAASLSVPVDGALVHPGAVFDAAARAKLAHVSAVASDHDGTKATYEGVTLAEIVRDAGAPNGDALRGSAARAYLKILASDGYVAVFSLGELTTSQANCAPFLAESRDGAPLSERDGPIQVVAPCDRTHARWVRGVVRLTVVIADGA